MTTEQKPEDQKKDEGATFDMYHFFSRKDVIIAALAIIVLLIFLLLKALGGVHAA